MNKKRNKTNTKKVQRAREKATRKATTNSQPKRQRDWMKSIENRRLTFFSSVFFVCVRVLFCFCFEYVFGTKSFSSSQKRIISSTANDTTINFSFTHFFSVVRPKNYCSSWMLVLKNIKRKQWYIHVLWLVATTLFPFNIFIIFHGSLTVKLLLFLLHVKICWKTAYKQKVIQQTDVIEEASIGGDGGCRSSSSSTNISTGWSQTENTYGDAKGAHKAKWITDKWCDVLLCEFGKWMKIRAFLDWT